MHPDLVVDSKFFHQNHTGSKGFGDSLTTLRFKMCIPWINRKFGVLLSFQHPYPIPLVPKFIAQPLLKEPYVTRLSSVSSICVLSPNNRVRDLWINIMRSQIENVFFQLWRNLSWQLLQFANATRHVGKHHLIYPKTTVLDINIYKRPFFVHRGPSFSHASYQKDVSPDPIRKVKPALRKFLPFMIVDTW